MNRRERMEARAARRREWAEKAQQRAASRFGTASQIADVVGGQPILVGHHSEAHARRDQDRIHSNMHKGCEEQRLAKRHDERASNLEAQLDRSIFSDDPDAIQALEARIAETEALADEYVRVNRAWRACKGDLAALKASGAVSDRMAETMAETMKRAPWLHAPLDATNLRAAIRRDKQRLAEIKRKVST